MHISVRRFGVFLTGGFFDELIEIIREICTTRMSTADKKSSPGPCVVNEIWPFPRQLGLEEIMRRFWTAIQELKFHELTKLLQYTDPVFMKLSTMPPIHWS